MNNSITLPVQILPNGKNLPLPSYATEGSAAVDLHAAIDTPIVLDPGKRFAIGTGIALALPIGFEAMIRPRSGLAVKHGLTVLNTPGCIDSDYRGEIKVILINLGDEAYFVKPGERIAQMTIAPVFRIDWKERDSLEQTARGAGGLGSTGS